MWSQDASTPTVGSCTCGTMTWLNAMGYIACLNNANYLGYNDWRLPTGEELVSITNEGETPYCEWLNGKGFTNVQPYWYWSSTTFANFTGLAWAVGMYDGNVYDDDKYSLNYVWPVRTVSRLLDNL
ncbi:MAG: DUF1566 domain-containing protein [Nitrospirae bacterium]|nr:DUF1566 domain-containing protein [Nitrospirota bacterium]